MNPFDDLVWVRASANDSAPVSMLYTTKVPGGTLVMVKTTHWNPMPIALTFVPDPVSKT